MMMPNSGVVGPLMKERYPRKRMRSGVHAPVRSGLRVRIGHALIAAGSALSGERVEQPARPPTLSTTV